MTAHIRIAIVVLALVPRAALAQTDLMALGRQEFETAKKEFNLGHYDKALEHFETSYRLTAAPELLYNLGVVNRQLFERTRKPEYLDAAIERFKSYLSNPKASQDPARRAVIEKDLKEAEDRLLEDKAARAKGEAALDLAEELLRAKRLADAQTQLDTYLNATGNQRAGVVRAAVLEAQLAVARKDASAAQAAYARALELDPNIKAPVDPEQNRAFDAARTQLGGAGPLAVAHTPPASVKSGAAIELGFQVTGDPLHLAEGIALSYRLGGSKAYSKLPLNPPGKQQLPRGFTATLPPGSRVEYYGVALDRRQAVLEHVGSDSAPFAVQIEPLKAPSVAKKWWFWTAMAGVAAVAATGIALGVELSRPPPPIEVPFRTGLQ